MNTVMCVVCINEYRYVCINEYRISIFVETWSHLLASLPMVATFRKMSIYHGILVNVVMNGVWCLWLTMTLTISTALTLFACVGVSAVDTVKDVCYCMFETPQCNRVCYYSHSVTLYVVTCCHCYVRCCHTIHVKLSFPKTTEVS